jgi:ABC-2 type transport system permease protein
MMADALTVALREWKELLWMGGALRGGKASILILLLVFGVYMPYQFGANWLTSPGMLLYWAWVPLMIVAGIVADSFAGERERHTLETLLASRLPDDAILAGKVLAAVGYTWVMVLAMLGIGIVTVKLTVASPPGVQIPWRLLVGAPLLALLGAVTAAGAGILVSLRAATVRQAAQSLNVAILAMVIVPAFAVGLLPVVWQARIGFWFSQVGPDRVLWIAVTAMLAGAAVLMAVARARFRRSKLGLD